MRLWNGFGRSLGFAIVAAAGASSLLLLCPPSSAALPWLRSYLLGIAVLYAAGLATQPRAALGAAAAGAALAALLWLLPLGLPGTVVGAAAIVAWLRSGLLYRARPLRAVATEAVLGLGGLALAAFLASGRPLVLTLGLGVWGYFLVQSVFFLVGGVSPRRAEGPQDPFDRARAELLALLR
jgi:hypothetical protein